jgi:ubiquitin C-terminal hydrolase
MELDMEGLVMDLEGKNPKFDLFGVSNHTGTPEFAHYISYAKNPVT